jgi:hypothetical protein
VYWFILLGVGLICALVARVLIISAAFRISWRWGIGVLLPFGPMAFRLTYPDDARPARPFQLAALPCFLLFIGLGPGLGSIRTSDSFFERAPAPPSSPEMGYGLEKPAPSRQGSNSFSRVAQSGPTVEARRAANTRELERLATRDKELKLRKRDLLRSDVAGNALYAHDLEEYETALAKANLEKAELESDQ